MTQQFFDARDLGWNTVEHDTADGTERTLRHVGLWRARLDMRADAAISPVKTELNVPRAPMRMTLRASATVVPA